MTPVPPRREYQSAYYRKRKAQRAKAVSSVTKQKARNDKAYQRDKEVANEMGLSVVSITQSVIVVAIFC